MIYLLENVTSDKDGISISVPTNQTLRPCLFVIAFHWRRREVSRPRLPRTGPSTIVMTIKPAVGVRLSLSIAG